MSKRRALFDSHVHSSASPDSKMEAAEAVEILQAQGLGLIFTEHVDYVTSVEGHDPEAADTPKASHNFLPAERYPRDYQQFKNSTVGLGLEIGLTAAFLPLNRLTAENGAWDYVIGSVHFVDGYDLYRTDFCDHCGEDGTDPYRRMLVYTREMVETSDFFDSLGHIDYISRYSPLDEKNVLYKYYHEEYDALFRLLIGKEKVLELNTARLGEPLAEANLFNVYKRYYELGGRYVTLGSDAHRPENLARNFNVARRMIHEIGLEPVHFMERKMFL